MAKRTCSIEGCGKEHAARGWCVMHWKRWKTHGTTADPVHIKRPCSVDDCGRYAEKRGWCGMHYQRWTAHGTTDAPNIKCKFGHEFTDETTYWNNGKRYCRPCRVASDERRRRSGPPCGLTGCGGRGLNRGLCGTHYQRWLKYGDPLATKLIRRNDEARFWAKVDKNGPVPAHRPELGPCWEWTTGRFKDYGIFSTVNREAGRSRTIIATRWILGHLRGRELERAELALHHCDNPPCVRPDHLYIGSHQDNMRDMVKRGRNKRTLKVIRAAA